MDFVIKSIQALQNLSMFCVDVPLITVISRSNLLGDNSLEPISILDQINSTYYPTLLLNMNEEANEFNKIGRLPKSSCLAQAMLSIVTEDVWMWMCNQCQI